MSDAAIICHKPCSESLFLCRRQKYSVKSHAAKYSCPNSSRKARLSRNKIVVRFGHACTAGWWFGFVSRQVIKFSMSRISIYGPSRPPASLFCLLGRLPCTQTIRWVTTQTEGQTQSRRTKVDSETLIDAERQRHNQTDTKTFTVKQTLAQRNTKKHTDQQTYADRLTDTEKCTKAKQRRRQRDSKTIKYK